MWTILKISWPLTFGLGTCSIYAKSFKLIFVIFIFLSISYITYLPYYITFLGGGQEKCVLYSTMNKLLYQFRIFWGVNFYIWGHSFQFGATWEKSSIYFSGANFFFGSNFQLGEILNLFCFRGNFSLGELFSVWANVYKGKLKYLFWGQFFH